MKGNVNQCEKVEVVSAISMLLRRTRTNNAAYNVITCYITVRLTSKATATFINYSFAKIKLRLFLRDTSKKAYFEDAMHSIYT